MAKFLVNMRVDYSFDVEADTPEEAEALAWEYDYQEDGTAYDGVYSIEVDQYLEDEEDDLNYIDESETVGEGKDE